MQSTDNKNPPSKFSADAETTDYKAQGPKPSCCDTDPSNPKDGITGIANGKLKPRQNPGD